MASSSLDAPPGVVRPVVFFDIAIGDTPAGRIKMGQLPSVRRLKVQLTLCRTV